MDAEYSDPYRQEADQESGQRSGPYFNSSAPRQVTIAPQGFLDLANLDPRLSNLTEDGGDGSGQPIITDGESTLEAQLEAHLEVDSGEEELISEAESDYDIHGLVDSARTGQLRKGSRSKRKRQEFDPMPKGWRKKRRTKEESSWHQKGVKRGFRKALDPTPEFKQLHTDATNAFMNGDYELAEYLAGEAIRENPEIFIAHSLLAEVYLAQGDKDKAAFALFNGAHTRPRDAETWSKVAELVLDVADDRQAALPAAVYCYNRIIGAERDNVDARFRRAALNAEAGRHKKAVYDYWQLSRRRPHDMEILRLIAESHIELSAAKVAIEWYDGSIAHYRTAEPYQAITFTWSYVNIYVELFLLSDQFELGIFKLKEMSRWMLGRGDETFWNEWQEDDREFDAEDKPRRISWPVFIPSKNAIDAYGIGLPLELRIRLGIFRLKLGPDHTDEAVRHFEWLEPEATGENSNVDEFPDLFKEVADTFKETGNHNLAIRFYEPLRRLDEVVDASFLTDLASCYRALMRWDEAESCYRSLVEIEGDQFNAHMELAAMFDDAGLPDRAKPYLDLAAQRRKRTYKKRVTDKFRLAAGEDTEDPDMPMQSIEAQDLLLERGALGFFGIDKKKPSTDKKKSGANGKYKNTKIDHTSLEAQFEEMRELKKLYDKGEEGARIQWMSSARDALERFRAVKVFFPFDRHLRFYGYGRKARARQWLYNRAHTKVQDESSDEELEDDEPESADTFCLVHFDQWLDCFLQYAFFLAKAGDSHNAYEVVQMTADCIIWYHDPKAMLFIHLIWCMCAIQVRDHKMINEVLRFFMKEQQFVTDAYRLFAAVNKLCSKSNGWYNFGPTQKFMLRQIKAVDYSLMPSDLRKGMSEERAAISKKDSDGNPIPAQDFDVALLVIYGHILYVGQSYAYSLNYFFRAHTLDPENSMITLTLALAYLHYALKRQAENRQTLVVQGISFLMQYHALRMKSPHAVERQEAEFNVGKAYHMLGLLHLCIPHYEKVLAMSREVQSEWREGEFAEDFAKEAAFALQGIWTLSGRLDEAMRVTEEWLVI